MKIVFLTFTLSLILSYCFGQSGYNYYEFGLGIGGDVSLVKANTNLPQENNHFAVSLGWTYNYTGHTQLSFECQTGTLSGGGDLPNQASLGSVSYQNHYISLLALADMHLGEVLNYQNSRILNILKNFYIGTGLGIIHSSLNATRISIVDPAFGFPGADQSVNLIIPIRFGYEFCIYDEYNEPSVALDLGYMYNFVFGSLNGYYDPSSNQNKPIEGYRQFSIGIKYFFGRTVSSPKLIRAFFKK